MLRLIGFTGARNKMEQLIIQLLGNSPTLIAVLLMYAHFERKTAVLETEINNLKEKGKKWI